MLIVALLIIIIFTVCFNKLTLNDNIIISQNPPIFEFYNDDYQPSPPICIVVICNNRPELLEKTLKSIVTANQFSHTGINNLYISQSGNDPAVSKVIEEYPNVYQNIDKDKKVATRLAKHFRWTFTKLFEETNCDGFVVIEDDLELSPDFLDYFRTVVPFLEADNTLLTASLWNDLGFKHNTRDKTIVKRTDFFPGLGWYLSRHVWDNILGPEWPDHDWDWYVRDKALKLKLDCLIPEIPRDYHVASTGTYMTKSFFNKYFKNININRDTEFKWKHKYLKTVSPIDSYKKRIINDIKNGRVLGMDGNPGPVIAWVDGFNAIRNKGLVRQKCGMFLRDTGIWEGEAERGRWQGIHHVWSQYLQSYLYIIDVNTEFTKHLINGHVFKDLEICDQFRTPV